MSNHGPTRPRRDSVPITLRNLIAARWVLLVLVSFVSLLELVGAARAQTSWLPANDYPWATLATIGVWAGHNGASMWLLRHERASEAVAGVHLLIDVCALTVLLGLADGVQNPFTLLYFLPITLATQVSPRWTWTLAAWSLACFAALFLLVPVGAEDPVMASAEHMGAEHMGAAERVDPSHAFGGHLRGMWFAFGLTGVLMTVFVHRIALALARQRTELARLRQEALEDRHLAAVGTLAAGAAHELGTPLGTIKLLTDELSLMDADEREQALITVREQLARCKTIVARMASPELRVDSLGGADTVWPLARLADTLRALEPGVPLRIELGEGADDAAVRQPFEVLAQLLRELVANAAEACHAAGPEADIVVRLGVDGGQLHAEVRDRGVGMSEAIRGSAFDPFFSTRPEGTGTGLGLYLARAHLRQLGGKIELDSAVGVGTRVSVSLPRVPADLRRDAAR